MLGAGCALAWVSWGHLAPPPAPAPTIVREAPAPIATSTAARFDEADVQPRTRSLSTHEVAACDRARADGGVSSSSPSVTYVVRTEVDRLLEQQADSIRGDRGGPHLLGPIDASRVDDPARRLGFRSGDLLLTVNGYQFATTEDALEAYGRLRRAEDVWTVFLRAGQVQSRLIRLC